MCRTSLYRVALVVVDLTRHLITPEGLLSILQADSLLGRLCISPWLCEAGVRQADMYGSEKLVCGSKLLFGP